jgi:hypothetical protein
MTVIIATAMDDMYFDISMFCIISIAILKF